MHTIRRWIPVLATLMLLAACAAPTQPGTQSGSLLVTIGGLPAGVDADVTVTGPGGFSQALTASETLTGLGPGSYTAAAQVLTTAATTEYLPEQAAIDVEVVAGQTAAATLLYRTTPGNLQLTVGGLPPATDADLTVTGPNGFSQGVSGSALLANLTPGSYVIAADQSVLRGQDAIVDALFELRSIDENVEVDSGATAAADVTWNRLEGSGRLWVALVLDVALAGYTPELLAAGGAPNADVTVSVAGGGSDEFVAFDGGGNAWVTNFSSDTISRYAAYQLESDATVTATVVIGSDGASLGTPSGLAFDADGNLWVANTGSTLLERFGPAQLAASGTPTPEVTIASDGASLPSPCGLAFDADGNLWVTNETDSLERFAPSQLAASGSPTPDITIGSDGSSLNNPCGLAFDAAGNLWVSANVGDTVEKFTPAQLAASGAPTPDVTLSGSGTSLDGPGSLAFDNGGNLWVSNANSELVERYAPNQLDASGIVKPQVALSVSNLSTGGLAFSPTPEGLPIRTPEVAGPPPT